MESDAETCNICCSTISVYSYGKCQHPICYKCSIRMRVLCKEFYCPICRTHLSEVIFSDKYLPKDVEFLNNYNSKENPSCGIYYESKEAKELSGNLLVHKCSKCDIYFKKFKELQAHIERLHNCFYCEVCLEHLKLFSFERRVYSHSDLLKHINEGDQNILNDKSHKGHPLCKFCFSHELDKNTLTDYSGRFLDDEELFKHLRKNHFYCYFCETNGIHKYYDTYSMLENHFKTEHFLCKEGRCEYERFTTAFSTEIEFKAHVLQEHSNAASRNSQRLLKSIDLASQANNPNRRREYMDSGTLIPSNNNVSTFLQQNTYETNFDGGFPDYERFQPGPSDFPALNGESSTSIKDTQSSNATKVESRKLNDRTSTDIDAPLVPESATSPSHGGTTFLPRLFNRTVKKNWGSNAPYVSEKAFPSLPSSYQSIRPPVLVPKTSSSISSFRNKQINNNNINKDSSKVRAQTITGNQAPRNLQFPTLPSSNRSMTNHSAILPKSLTDADRFFVPTLSSKHSSKHLQSKSSLAAPNKSVIGDGHNKKKSSSKTRSTKAPTTSKTNFTNKDQDSGDEEYVYNSNEYESFGINNVNVTTSPPNEFQKLLPIRPNNLINDSYPSASLSNGGAPFVSNRLGEESNFPTLGYSPTYANLGGVSWTDSSLMLNKFAATAKQKLPPPIILPPSNDINKYTPKDFPSLHQQLPLTMSQSGSGPSTSNNARPLPFRVTNQSVHSKQDKRVKDEQRFKDLVSRLNNNAIIN